MKILTSILAIYGFLNLLPSIVRLIRYAKSDKKRYFKFNIVRNNSEKEEFAVKAKNMISAMNIIQETLYTKDFDKRFEFLI